MTPSPGRVSIATSFVSLFTFYILSYLLSKIMGCLCGCLVASASVQKLFCGICSVFKWYFDESGGGRKWSPCPIPLPSSMYSGPEFEQALRVFDGQRSLTCCNHGVTELDMTEQLNWTDASTVEAPKYIKQILTDTKWEINSNTITVGDLIHYLQQWIFHPDRKSIGEHWP